MLGQSFENFTSKRHPCDRSTPGGGFRALLKRTGKCIGQEFAIGEIQKAVGVAAETARDWLNARRRYRRCLSLASFLRKRRQMILIKKSKLYFTDTGLAAWLR